MGYLVENDEAPASSKLRTAPASAAQPSQQQQQEQQTPPSPEAKGNRADPQDPMHGFKVGDDVVVAAAINVRNTVVALPGELAKVTGPSDQNDGKARVRVRF